MLKDYGFPFDGQTQDKRFHSHNGLQNLYMDSHFIIMAWQTVTLKSLVIRCWYEIVADRISKKSKKSWNSTYDYSVILSIFVDYFIV